MATSPRIAADAMHIILAASQGLGLAFTSIDLTEMPPRPEIRVHLSPKPSSEAAAGLLRDLGAVDVQLKGAGHTYAAAEAPVVLADQVFNLVVFCQPAATAEATR